MRNRVMVSPMVTLSADDGIANGYHLVHLGRMALGGAGLVVSEATAVAPEGRVTRRDLGLWNDRQAEALKPVVEFVKEYGAVAGIQLGHAGRKGCIHAAHPHQAGGGPVTVEDAREGHEWWEVVAPSARAASPRMQVPREMSIAEIEQSVMDWQMAARRAQRVGFEVIELHGAHGYLLHTFQSPLTNYRTDRYGGDFERRTRYPLEVVAAVRQVFDGVLMYRVSAVDGLDGGISLDDTIEFARRLGDAGVDVIDTSSGGISADHRAVDTRVPRGYGYHVPFSRAIKSQTDLVVATVGMVTDPRQAEAILAHGEADLVAIGRELLADPNWPLKARAVLEGESFDDWPRQARAHLALRKELVDRLSAAGEFPMSRYPRAHA